jgi:hypothetical protein
MWSSCSMWFKEEMKRGGFMTDVWWWDSFISFRSTAGAGYCLWIMWIIWLLFVDYVDNFDLQLVLVILYYVDNLIMCRIKEREYSIMIDIWRGNYNKVVNWLCKARGFKPRLVHFHHILKRRKAGNSVWMRRQKYSYRGELRFLGRTKCQGMTPPKVLVTQVKWWMF